MKYLVLSIVLAVAAALIGCATTPTAPPDTFDGDPAITGDLHRTLIAEHSLDLSETPHTVSAKFGQPLQASTITHLAETETGNHHFFLVVEDLDLQRQAFADSQTWFDAIDAYRARRREALNHAAAYIAERVGPQEPAE